MLNGINHVTYAVRDLNKSFGFYTKVLGLRAEVRWDKGAYLSLGSLWFCLNVDESSASLDCSHLAFDICEQDFLTCKQKLEKENVVFWKENSSEGQSLYFLDPDNHKLEIHVGSLQTRMDSIKTQAFKELVFY